MTSGRQARLDLFLEQAVKAFAADGFESPRQEARALIQAVAGISRATQLAHPEQPLDEDLAASLEEALSLRLQGKPLAQIAGRAWFYGLPFRVTEWTLTPRPETEHLVEAAIRLLGSWPDRGEPLRILDTFAGTGAVGLSLAFHLKKEGIAFDLTLADSSGKALETAAANAGSILPGDPVRLVRADIWPQGLEPFDLILANPPYIVTEAIGRLMPEVAVHEPVEALDGGADGLAFYRRLAGEGKQHLAPGGLLMLEVGAGQADPVTAIFRTCGWLPRGRDKDLLGHVRVLLFSARSHVI
jgi:release factor glutamine methyltransferase